MPALNIDELHVRPVLEVSVVPDRWYVILESKEVSHTPLKVTRLKQKLVLWRDAQGRICCTDDACPHRGAALSLGQVVDGCIECPFHGFRFAADGQCTKIPANGPKRPIPAAMRVRAWTVCEAHGFIWLWFGTAPNPLLPVPWFKELDERFIYGSFTDDWPIHYTRAIENQLDFTHLPFAHRTTIGRGLPEHLDILMDIQGDRIRVTYDPTTYDAKGFFIEFVGPNVWLNRLSDAAFATIAFVPIDEENTKLYLRFYQRFVTLPGLGWLACAMANLSNRFILSQDKRIVLTQEPRRSDLGMAEVLVSSDRPIAFYRRWRATLLRGGGEDLGTDDAEPIP
jgi:phenylpropionate dioxygenase-like ring-hydroxylating dioxygenase large terminal subunit